VESAVAIGDLRPPFLLAANHTSLLDPLVMFALPPRLRARLAPAARWNFFTEHPRGAFLYFWGVLGLDLFPLVQSGDWRPTLRIGGELADRGHSILIYPEGRISEDGAVHELKLGVAVMSRDLHLPIVPCATAGLERVLPPGSRRPQRESWRRPVVAVCIGEPIPAARPDEDLGDLVESLGQRIRRLHNQARAIRDRRERRGDRPSATQ
jgi:1-acyl-sn-glycerol-3-phosphate acyltransferase